VVGGAVAQGGQQVLRVHDRRAVDGDQQVAEGEAGRAPRAAPRQADDDRAATRAEAGGARFDLGRGAQHDTGAQLFAEAFARRARRRAQPRHQRELRRRLAAGAVDEQVQRGAGR
jgi:hypothetical protein